MQKMLEKIELNWKEVFDYHDGKIFWKVKLNRRIMDKPLGYLNSWGYLTCQFKGKGYQVSRIIYEMHFGIIKKGLVIDHIDGDKLNNKIENLRIATRRQNQYNRGPQNIIGKTSIFKGVSFDRKTQKWRADIRLKSKAKYLGSYSNELDAVNAYNLAANNVHKSYARLNHQCADT